MLRDPPGIASRPTGWETDIVEYVTSSRLCC